MQALEQRINFYQAIFHKPVVRLPLQQMLMIWVLVLVVLSMVALVDFVRTRAQRDQIVHLQAAYHRMESAVQQLNARVEKMVEDPALKKQDAYLRESLDSKRHFLAALQVQGDTHQMHFSGVLEGLASLDAKSLWLTRIIIRSPGPELSLSGLTSEAKALPEYLESLNREDVFEGVKFHVLDVERVEQKSRYLTFNVSTRNEDDAGR